MTGRRDTHWPMGDRASEPTGAFIAGLRIAAGLSARQLAARAGISHSSVCRAERGHAVTRDVLASLARILGPSVYDAVRVWPPVPKGSGALVVARRATGESRREAATRAGVSDDVLARAEAGKGIHPSNAKLIADAFGLAVVDVLPVPPTREANTRRAA